MWGLNDQISKIAQNFSCPTGRGLLDCLRKESGADLQKVLLATGTQFQPVTDNVTIFKESVYVHVELVAVANVIVAS